MPKPQRVRQPKKRPSLPPPPKKPKNKNHPAALKHLPRTRTKPPAQRRLLTSALYPQTAMYRRSPTDPRARFDHTDIPHAWQLWHGNLHSMSPTKHRIDLLLINIFGGQQLLGVGREKEEKIRGKVGQAKAKAQGPSQSPKLKAQSSMPEAQRPKRPKRHNGHRANGPTGQRAKGP